MGLTLGLVGGAISAVLFLLFGYELWVMIAAGALWAIAMVVAALYGHRAFGTRAHTDLHLVFLGLAITASVAVPKFAERRPCARVQRAAAQVEAAQQEWKQGHGAFATELASLSLELDPSVTVSLDASEAGFTVTATHPGCVDERGALITERVEGGGP